MEQVAKGFAFGFKTAWVAARNVDGEALVAALKLTDVQRIGWEQGVTSAYIDGVFVTPPVGVWTLAVGSRVLLELPRADELSRILSTEVQVFATHRVSESHHWELAVDGRTVRRFSIGDGTVYANEGEATDAEVALDLGELATLALGPLTGDEDFEFPDEESVVAIAGSWSVDPSELADSDDEPGWLSRLAKTDPSPTSPSKSVPQAKRGLLARLRRGDR